MLRISSFLKFHIVDFKLTSISAYIILYSNAKLVFSLRFCWGVILLGMMCYMVAQIVSRIQDFTEVPRAVNMDVQYGASMKFPAITICNNNVIRYGHY